MAELFTHIFKINQFYLKQHNLTIIIQQTLTKTLNWWFA